MGTTACTSDADQIVTRLADIAARHGFTILRDERSRLSVSRYLSIGRVGHAGFDAGKSLRRRFCAEMRMSFPRGTTLNVRVSDHRGYGDGTTVHASVMLDDASAGLSRVEAALTILAEICP